VNLIIKYLLVSLLFSTTLFAQSKIILDSNNINISDFQISYYIDKTQEMRLKEIKEKPFIEAKNKLSLGVNAQTVWIKAIIQNKTNRAQKLYLHSQYAYHNKSISYFEFKNDVLLKSQITDLNHVDDTSQMYRGSSLFEFTVSKNETKTIYIKNETYSHQWFTLLLFDEENSKRALMNTHNDIAFLIGILFALMIYNIFLHLSSTSKEHIYYSVYLLSAIIWISLSYGLLANIFDIYGLQPYKLHISLIVMPIFLILFIMEIFETKKEYITEHLFLIFMILLLFIDLVYALFNISGALRHASTLAALIMIVTIGVSLSLLKKKHPIAKYFLIGHIFFLLFNVIAVLFYKGLIDFTYVSSHGVGIGIMLEALMLAFILTYRIKILEELKKSQSKLKIEASTDPLTKLYNRRYFYNISQKILNLSKRDKTALSILMLDIDLFKNVNDNYGHQVGDEVIILLSKKLQELSRDSDVVCRYGGEEFVILLPHTHLNGAVMLAEKLRQEVENLSVRLNLSDEKEGNRALKFTVSIGVTQIDAKHDSSIKTSIERADRALYEAKEKGRNRVCSKS